MKYTEDDHTFAVCAYGTSEYLESAVRSCLQQSKKSHVLISTSTPNDHICRVADKYGLPLIVNRGPAGIAGDWNAALTAVKTPLVTLAHQDDVYGKHFTECTLAYLNRSARPLIVFTDYYELRDGAAVRTNTLLKVKRLMLTPLKLRLLWGSVFVRRRILSIGSAICCPSVTMVKGALPQPLFENNMKSNIDWQAWERISRQPGDFVYVPRPLVEHRIHSGSTTSSLLRDDGRKEEDMLMFRKFWPEWAVRCLEKVYSSAEKSNEI